MTNDDYTSTKKDRSAQINYARIVTGELQVAGDDVSHLDLLDALAVAGLALYRPTDTNIASESYIQLLRDLHTGRQKV